MDYKKSKAPSNTVTHNLMDFAEPTDNIYESIVIMSKRANQIGAKMKEDLSRKLKEFASSTENLEETFENREQIERFVAENADAQLTEMDFHTEKTAMKQFFPQNEGGDGFFYAKLTKQAR